MKLSTIEKKILLQLSANPYLSAECKRRKRFMDVVHQLQDKGLIELGQFDDYTVDFTEAGSEALQ